MKTLELVSHICREHSEWQVPTVLMYLNEVQRRMLSRPLRSREIFDPLTGKHPVLQTQDGVFVYTLSVLEGFPEDAIMADLVYGDDVTYEAQFVEGSSSEKAKIMIPPTVSGSLSIRAYKAPREIKSPSVEMEIPESFHFSTVLVGVQGYLEQAEYGRSELLEKFERTLLPKFWEHENFKPKALSGEAKPYYHGR